MDKKIEQSNLDQATSFGIGQNLNENLVEAVEIIKKEEKFLEKYIIKNYKKYLPK